MLYEPVFLCLFQSRRLVGGPCPAWWTSVMSSRSAMRSTRLCRSLEVSCNLVQSGLILGNFSSSNCYTLLCLKNFHLEIGIGCVRLKGKGFFRRYKIISIQTWMHMKQRSSILQRPGMQGLYLSVNQNNVEQETKYSRICAWACILQSLCLSLWHRRPLTSDIQTILSLKELWILETKRRLEIKIIFVTLGDRGR